MDSWTPEQFLDWLNKGREIAQPGSLPLAEIPHAAHRGGGCFVARAWGINGVGVHEVMYDDERPDTLTVNQVKELHAAGIITDLTSRFTGERGYATFPEEAVEWIRQLCGCGCNEHTLLKESGLFHLCLPTTTAEQYMPPLVLVEQDEDEETVEEARELVPA